MGWWSSSPPVPCAAPAPAREDEHGSGDPPVSSACWLYYRASDLSHVGSWRCLQFDSPNHRDWWVSVWGCDFEIWVADSASSDAAPPRLPS